jgi:hypothetical protein
MHIALVKCIYCISFGSVLDKQEWIGKTTLLESRLCFWAEHYPRADAESLPENLKQ